MSQPEPPAPLPAPRESKLVRGLNLLNCFGPDDDVLRLSQLAARAQVPLPTAHRLVQELELCGMLERVGCHLRLGRALALLATRAQGHLHTLLDDSLPLLARLHDATGLDVVFSARYGSQTLPIGHLSRLGGTRVVSYAPPGSVINSTLVAGALRRHDRGLVTPEVVSHGEVTGVSAAISPPGTAIRAAVTLIGRGDRDAVAAAVPHVHAVAQGLSGQLADTAAVPLATSVPPHEPCPDTPSMLYRGLSLLNSLRAGETRVTLSELAHRTGLPKSTAHRLISVLIDYQFLQEGGAGIMFGPRVFALSAQVPSRRLLRAAALPWQRSLCEQSAGFSCLMVPNAPVMDSLTCVYPGGPAAADGHADISGTAESLCAAAARATVRTAAPDGPFALLAEDSDGSACPPSVVASEHGYAVATASCGLTALAVPVLTDRGTPDAVLTLVTQAPGLGTLRTWIRTARTAAADISRACANLPTETAAGLAH